MDRKSFVPLSFSETCPASIACGVGLLLTSTAAAVGLAAGLSHYC